jgi:hypothetical protein
MSNSKVQATFHPNGKGKWVTYREDQRYYAAYTDRDGYVVHTHPIPFDSQREADRAVARLNARDEERWTG